MPTDTFPRRTRTADFVLRAAAWGLVIFGLLRLDGVERHGLLPLTRLQGRLASWICGAPALPIEATLACSGADLLAICLGAILAYPVRWRRRLAGAGAGLALILALNTLRIGTLGRLAASPSLFAAFHVYLWPAALSVAVAGFVFAWMRVADRRPAGIPPLSAQAPLTAPGEPRGFRPTRRFALLAGALLLVFTAAAPLYLESAGLLSAAVLIARAAAAALRLLGVEAQATANQLWTARGSFLVTQECISTPLIPVYVAAVLAYGETWRSRVPALLAAVPLFFGLGIARLLVVALPAFLPVSTDYLVHAFFQILAAAAVVLLAALWRHHDRGAAARRALLGAGLGLSFVWLLGGAYSRLVLRAAGLLSWAPGTGAVGLPPEDPQGAIALLPPFQAGLYLALWVAARAPFGWKRFLAGLALLGLSQPATLALLPLLVGRVGAPLQVQAVRAWSLAAPILVLAFLNRFRDRQGR